MYCPCMYPASVSCTMDVLLAPVTAVCIHSVNLSITDIYHGCLLPLPLTWGFWNLLRVRSWLLPFLRFISIRLDMVFLMRSSNLFFFPHDSANETASSGYGCGWNLDRLLSISVAERELWNLFPFLIFVKKTCCQVKSEGGGAKTWSQQMFRNYLVFIHQKKKELLGLYASLV